MKFVGSLVPRRSGSTIAMVLVFAGVALSGRCVIAAELEKCERVSSSEVMSPDMRWIARLYGNICDLGIGSSAAVRIELSRVGASAPATTVLSIDMPSSKSLWPRARWDSSSILAIQLPANANIALQMATFQNIDIKVGFCPSDPIDREKWLTFRKAYRNWIDDLAEWTSVRNRGIQTSAPRPIQPVPPARHEPSETCQF